MSIIELLLKELDQEAKTTRKMLERVPDDKLDWRPHVKSMTMLQLTTHISELPGWVSMGLLTREMDFAKTPYTPSPVRDTAELLQLFEHSLEEGRSALSDATDEDLLPTWTMRDGDRVFNVFTKYEVVRHAFSQIIHHRAQLGVYLRLLNIPIPGSYGPSADEVSL